MSSPSPGETRWSIAGRKFDLGNHTLAPVRRLSADEAEQVRTKIAYVHRFAERGAAHRVFLAARRWQRTMETIAEELDVGAISLRTLSAANADLIALVALTTRSERELADDLKAHAGVDIRAFDAQLHAIHASPAYLVALQMVEYARGDGLSLAHGDQSVYFTGAPSTSALDVGPALLGFAHALAVRYMHALREEFETAAAPIKEMAAEVKSGAPGLVGTRDNPDTGEPASVTITDLPLKEIAGVEAVLAGRPGESPALSVSRQLELDSSLSIASLSFGETEADSALVSSVDSEGLDSVSTATFELDLDLLGSEPIDYWAPLAYSLSQSQHRHERFRGSVQEASIDDTKVEIQAEDAVDLTDHTTRGSIAWQMSLQELVHSLAARAGWPEGLIRTTGDSTEEHDAEPFEVVTPVTGITVEEPVDIASVRMVPLADGEQALDRHDVESLEAPAEELAAAFRDATSYAMISVTAGTVHEAEELALEAIDLSLAWYVARARYGLAKAPDGTPQRFSRQAALQLPRRGSVVLVDGSHTGRGWLRWPAEGGRPAVRELRSDSPAAEMPFPLDASVAERQALLALNQAVSESNPLAQVGALWQAIESYTAGTKHDVALFADAELEELQDQLPENLGATQRRAITRAIANLNQPSARDRLKIRLAFDGVPITAAEFNLLFDLRSARNKAVHGGHVESLPTREQINHGISLVARMLTFRLAREEQT